MNKTVLILGGTGAMGNHLVQLLEQGEYDVYVTSRRPMKIYPNITYLQGNAHDDTFLFPILFQRKWDVIVDFMIYNTSEFAGRVEKILI